jgi:peroxiredoxin
MTYKRHIIAIALAVFSIVAITMATTSFFVSRNRDVNRSWKNLSAEFTAAKKALEAEYKDASEEQKPKIKQKLRALPLGYAPRFLDVARINLHDENAFIPLYDVVVLVEEGQSLDEALILLRENFADNRDTQCASLWMLLPELLERRSDEVNPFLSSVIERNPLKDIRGSACVYLAIRLKWQAEFSGSQELADKSSQLFNRAINEFSDAKCRGNTVGKEAQRELDNLQGPLGIGHVAPDTEGEDLDGTKFKLSDYRGKVALLSFCGQWCSCCRKMYPHEQLLINKLADKPFVFIEVNSDGDRNSHKEFMKQKNFTWRCFADGQHGPISAAWGIQASPTYYMLDRNGVIRYKAFDCIDDATLTKWTDVLLNENASE